VGPSSIASPADTGLKARQANSLSTSLNDRSWHQTDMPTALRNVRFRGAKQKTSARIELFRF
jgi:hypothetical protein